MSSHRTNDHLLDINHVSLSYGANVILRDVNASITRSENYGEVICLLGPSGMGKTQLSRIIAGLHQSTSGEVRLSDGPTQAGKVCCVPQFYPLFDYLSVAGNLVIAGKQGNLSPKDCSAKVAKLSEQFGLNDHLHKYPSELSGGTKQRVAIARQLMCATKYMVMDEPFSGLDPEMKMKAAEAIITLSQTDTYGVTIVVTHDIETGLMVSDRVLLLGYEPDGRGGYLPGARFVGDYDLDERGLCWTPDVNTKPEFVDLVREIKTRFKTLR